MTDGCLPEVKWVRHARATQLKLVVSAKGIRLTLPLFVSEKQAQAFLSAQQEWLQQTWKKYQEKQQKIAAVALPEVLELSYYPEKITVQYHTDSPKLFIFDSTQHYLSIHAQHAHLGLTKAVVALAKIYLPQQLLRYAQQYKLTVNGVRIATPMRRWGSCSGQQKIMLHAGILLMPKSYADYVLLHELAHTKEMNHQAGFWSLLDTMYPYAKTSQVHVKRFKLPAWWQTHE